MLLSLLSLAAADADLMMAPCMGPMVSQTLPAAGARQVPVDALPAFIWQEDCGEAGRFVAQLWQGEELVHEEVFDTPGGQEGVGLERLMLKELLLPETDYLLRLSGPEGEQDIEFSTGTEQVVGAEPPELLDAQTQVSRYRWTFWAFTDLRVEQGEDPDALSALLLLDGEGRAVAASTQSPVVLDHYVAGDIADLPEEICHSVVQVDGLGAESEPIEHCWNPEDPGLFEGCSSAPAGASLLAGLCGMLLALRRRR